MRKKGLYPLIAFLILAVFFSLALRCMGMQIGPVTEEDKQLILDEAIDENLDENYRPVPEVATKEQTEDSIASEENISSTGEATTYSGNAEETAVILIVNFKTTKVTGSVSQSESYYIDATVNGKINIDTLEITSNFFGIWRDIETGEEFPFNGIISGIITDDLSTFNGMIQPDYLEEGVEFTATK